MDASKIKLIIWDLDETFWHGTISEQKVAPVKQACDLVLLSSKKGIVNSICSKNDEKPCIDKLKEWDLANLIRHNALDERTASIIFSGICDNSLTVNQPQKDKVRANIFKNMLAMAGK